MKHLMDLIRVEYRLPASKPIPTWAWDHWRAGLRYVPPGDAQ